MRLTTLIIACSILHTTYALVGWPGPLGQPNFATLPKRTTNTQQTKTADSDPVSQSPAPRAATLDSSPTSSPSNFKTTASSGTNIEAEEGYNDVYGCKGVNVTAVEGLSKVKYGCFYQARVSYLINVGLQAVGNLTWILNNNETYTKNYNAFAKKVQENLLMEFGEWLHDKGGQKFYQCVDSKHINKCLQISSGLAKIANCRSMLTKFENMYIPQDKLSDAAKSLSSFYNATIQVNDLEAINPSQNIYYDDLSWCTFTMHNVTAPKVTDLMPNPMTAITKDNLTNYIDLFSHIYQNLDSANPFDLQEHLTPVPLLASTARSVMQFNEQGALIRKEEEIEKKMMIISLAFGLFGAATAFLGAVESLIANTILSFVESIVTFTVLGSGGMGSQTVITMLISMVGDVFSVFKAGRSFLEGANALRFNRASGVSQKLLSFDDYKDSLEQIYSLVFDSQSQSQN